MTMQDARLMTVEEFEAFVELPANASKRFEFIGGEIVEVPNNTFVSYIAGLILTYFNLYLFSNDIGYVTGEGGGYKVATERYAPDVAFISYDTQKELNKQGYNNNPLDLAVEVVSSDSKTENDELTIKLGNYLSVGTMVWIVRPEKKQIEVYESGKGVKIYRQGDTLKLETVLPNFELALNTVFRK